jgi:hypothetical protein
VTLRVSPSWQLGAEIDDFWRLLPAGLDENGSASFGRVGSACLHVVVARRERRLPLSPAGRREKPSLAYRSNSPRLVDAGEGTPALRAAHRVGKSH